MAVRILLMLATLAFLYGCGQASSPAGKREKQGGVEEALPKTVTPAPDQEVEATTAGAGDMLTTGQENGEARNSKPPTDGCLGKYRLFGSVQYSPDGQKIVFVSRYYYDAGHASASPIAPGTSPDEADEEICVVNADGTDMVRLTDDSKDEGLIAWSPDGSRIAFVRSSAPDDEDIFVMNADGSNETRLRDSAYVSGLTWSPDGQEIAFGTQEKEIHIMRADGSGKPRTLVSDPAWQRVVHPAWSPDGKWIAFASERDTGRDIGEPSDIYVMQVDDIDRWRQLTDSPELYDDNPAWSPDGTEIAFNRSGGVHNPTMIYKVDSDGSNETRLAIGALPTWLPDGVHVAYVSEQDLNVLDPYVPDLYVVNSDGSDPTLVIADRVE